LENDPEEAGKTYPLLLISCRSFRGVIFFFLMNVRLK
jgi:hypothetical protein